MSTLQELYNSALEIIKEHNKQIFDGDSPHPRPSGWVDPTDFLQALKAIGGTSEERLRKMTAEDVLSCLPGAGMGVRPMPLAKDLVKALRGTDKDIAQTGESRPVSGKKADRMTPFELITAYDAEDADNAVGRRLAAISKGQTFLVFQTSGGVDVQASAKLLEEIRKGFPGREIYEDRPVYSVGACPNAYADENPIFEGRPLRPDGTCDQTNRSWEGVSLEVRQLVRLAVQLKELAATVEKAHDVMDIAVGPDPVKKLRVRYKKACLRYTELAGTGDLPKLKIALGRKEQAAGRPFDNGKKVHFDHGKKVHWSNQTVWWTGNGNCYGNRYGNPQ